MTDRVPGAPGQYTMTVSAQEAQKLLTGEAVSVNLVRDDEPLVEGTPYNKQSVLPDDLAALICPSVVDPAPADAFRGVLAKRTVVILGKSNWTNNKQTVTVAGVTADVTKTDVFASPDPGDENYAAYVECGVRPFAQMEGAVTFKCEDVPGINLTVNVAVRV